MSLPFEMVSFSACWENLHKLYRFPIARAANSELTTAQLAERTGLSAGTLRMWESRHRFPDPSRLPGGHRRYSEADVEQVREVLRLRDQGLSLPAAIERVRGRRPPVAVSVFAGLRRRRPEVAPTVLPKPAVLALSRAIEDEYCARAAGGVLIGCFQRERFYRRAQRRWRELARTADLAVALADFSRCADPGAGPVGGAGQPAATPSPGSGRYSSAPAGSRHAWPRGSGRAGPRCPTPRAASRCSGPSSPTVVADAVDVAAELLGRSMPAWPVAVRAAHEPPPRIWTPRPALRYGGAVAHRMVGYLGQMLSGPGEPRHDVRG